ncbi:MAG: hypothetical protein R3D69_19170 [Xanthobacteraceae bacterium]
MEIGWAIGGFAAGIAAFYCLYVFRLAPGTRFWLAVKRDPVTALSQFQLPENECLLDPVEKPDRSDYVGPFYVPGANCMHEVHIPRAGFEVVKARVSAALAENQLRNLAMANFVLRFMKK